ncbi:MAG: PepSY-associated TM helix domain-containing protein [Candidatus Kapaibacterium sp.]
MEIKNGKYYKLNKSLHRDIGYLFVFMTLIYSISGIAINHAKDWNPDFYVRKENVEIKLPKNVNEINENLILNELDRIGENFSYLMYDSPNSDKVKIYFKDGAIMCDLETGKAELERVTKRHLLFEMNWLHRNPGGVWTIVSDIFAVSLIFLSISGMFIMKGRNSLKRRGKWWVGAGFVATIFFMFIIMI